MDVSTKSFGCLVFACEHTGRVWSRIRMSTRRRLIIGFDKESVIDFAAKCNIRFHTSSGFLCCIVHQGRVAAWHGGVAAEQEYVEEHCGRSWVEFEQQRPSRIWMRHEWEVVCIFRLCITMCADLMQLHPDAMLLLGFHWFTNTTTSWRCVCQVVLVCRMLLCIDIRARGRTLTGQGRASVLWVQSVSKVKTYEAPQPCRPL